MIDRLRAAIAAHRFSFSTEDDLQRGIAEVLTGAGLLFEREFRLSVTDRIDFLLPDRIGIEVKIDGSISLLTRQLHRYSRSEAIGQLVVVTSRNRLTNLPRAMNGKPIHTIALMAAF